MHAFKESGLTVHTVAVQVTPADRGGRDEPPQPMQIEVLDIDPPYEPSEKELLDLFEVARDELKERHLKEDGR